MLLDPDDPPSGQRQQRVGFLVTFYVPLKLRSPIVGIGFGNQTVLRAATFKAAVDEYRNSRWAEDDVRSTAHILNSLRINAVAKA